MWLATIFNDLLRKLWRECGCRRKIALRRIEVVVHVVVSGKDHFTELVEGMHMEIYIYIYIERSVVDLLLCKHEPEFCVFHSRSKKVALSRCLRLGPCA